MIQYRRIDFCIVVSTVSKPKLVSYKQEALTEANKSRELRKRELTEFESVLIGESTAGKDCQYDRLSLDR
jgi:hypothetical protein